MNLQEYIDSGNMTKYHLSQIIGAPDADYDQETGLPKSKQYLECDLPPYLQSSIDNMVASWKVMDSGGKDYHWDMYWSELNADINSAEVEQEISSKQAWYLREKYLRMKRDN